MPGCTLLGVLNTLAPPGVVLTSIGVSISMKFWFVRYSLVACAAWCLMRSLCCIAGLLKSRYLCNSLRSSLGIVLSSTSNGGVSAWSRTCKLSHRTSISPVTILVFVIPCGLSLTCPVICSTHSLPICCAASCACLL